MIDADLRSYKPGTGRVLALSLPAPEPQHRVLLALLLGAIVAAAILLARPAWSLPLRWSDNPKQWAILDTSAKHGPFQCPGLLTANVRVDHYYFVRVDAPTPHHPILFAWCADGSTFWKYGPEQTRAKLARYLRVLYPVHGFGGETTVTTAETFVLTPTIEHRAPDRPSSVAQAGTIPVVDHP